MARTRLSHPEPLEPPLRPRLADQPSRFVVLARSGVSVQAAADYSEALSGCHADSQRWFWESTVARWECRFAHTAADGRVRNHYPPCRLSNRAISARSRPAFCCCLANRSKPRPAAGRWSGDFQSLVWEKPTRSSGACARSCGELRWVDPHTVVAIVGDGAEWIWSRATKCRSLFPL